MHEKYVADRISESSNLSQAVGSDGVFPAGRSPGTTLGRGREIVNAICINAMRSQGLSWARSLDWDTVRRKALAAASPNLSARAMRKLMPEPPHPF